MAPHSSTLAWKIPWVEEPGGLQSMGSLESNTTERLHFHFSLSCIGEGNGNPLQCSCLENPRDGGAWWAAVHGVAQSRTRLKRLSSSSSSAEAEGWDGKDAHFFHSVAAMKKLFSQWNFWIDTITDEVWILLPYECHQTLIWTNLMNTDCFISSHFTKIFSFNLFPYYFTFKAGCLFLKLHALWMLVYFFQSD